MANKPLKSITFPGLTDTYTIPQIDTSLTVEGKAADAQAVGNKFTEVSATAGKAYPTDTASGAVATFTDGADDIPVKSCVVAIEPVQSGSGDPSPDNVRPISGWTGAQVVRTGANVWDEEWEVGGISSNNGEPITNTDRIRSKNFCPILPSTTYYCCNNAYSQSVAGYIWLYDKDKAFISFAARNNNTFTTPSNAHYFKISTYGGNYNVYNNDISINYPATDTDYHPYAGDTYSITFPSEAGTVYGGTLDVTNGVLTVDRAMVDLGTLTWSKNSDALFFYSNTPPLFGNGGTALVSSTAKNVCENYKHATVSLTDPVNGCFSVANSQEIPILRLSDNRFNDAQSLTAALDGVKAVFELTEPITYTLTPTEIKSLLGDNNIWADAGDTEVTYRADTKLYIDKKIAEVINALS